ncbi:MAG: T9SS type A sorting domain-containing protein [Bacteroidia bacterium]|nr:T9SS type A sorting domain-containing protein [Bacteroidia bacterium]
MENNSKKIVWIVFILLFYWENGKAQYNLVPNPSFEILSDCPTQVGQIQNAIGWINPNLCSPDLYNSCNSTTSVLNVPNYGLTGYLEAHTGGGYLGIFTYGGSEEFINVPREIFQRLQPMQNGQYLLRARALSRLMTPNSNSPIQDFRISIFNDQNYSFPISGSANINSFLNNLSPISSFTFQSPPTATNNTTPSNWRTYSTCFNFDNSNQSNNLILSIYPTYTGSDLRGLLLQDLDLFPFQVDLGQDITTNCRTVTISTQCPIPSVNGDIQYYLYYINDGMAEELVAQNTTGIFEGVYPPTSPAQYIVRLRYFNPSDPCMPSCDASDLIVVKTNLGTSPARPKIIGDGFACTSNPVLTLSNASAFSSGYIIQWLSTDQTTTFSNSSGATTNVSYTDIYSSPTDPSIPMKEQVISVRISNGNGCFFYDEMPVFQCCSTFIDLGAGTTAPSSEYRLGDALGFGGIALSSNLTPTNAATYFLNGVFQVDNNLTLSYNQVFMGPMARIEIVTGGSLTINGGYIRNGCHVMWDKIDMINGGVSTFNKPTIEDGISAVYSEHGSEYGLIDKCTFNKNFRGVFINGYNGNFGSVNQNSLKAIERSKFDCNPSTLISGVNVCPIIEYPPYKGCRSMAGVVIKDISGEIILNRKEFGNFFLNHLDFGIYSADNYSVQIFDEEFTDLYNNLINKDGFGIYNHHRMALDPTNVIPPIFNIYRNKFNNCLNGIYSFGTMPLTFSENTIHTTILPIEIFGHLFSEISIDRNKIFDNFEIGIYLRNITGSDVKITQNTISGIGNGYEQKGIYVGNASQASFMKLQIGSSPSYFQTHYGVSPTPCTSSFNTITGVKRGIWLRFVSPGLIAKRNYVYCNNISLANYVGESSFAFGIGLENSRSLSVVDNAITKPSYTTTGTEDFQKFIGHYQFQSPHNNLFLNSFENMGSAALFKSTNSPSRISCNNVNVAYCGFYFANSTQGNQFNGHRGGNMFNNMMGSGTLNRRLMGITASQENWWYGTGAELLHNSVISAPGIIPITYFGSWSCTNSDPQPFIESNLSNEEFRAQTFESIVTNQKVYSNESELMEYLEKKEAYYFLLENDSLLNLGIPSDSLYSNFMDSMASTSLEKIRHLIYEEANRIGKLEDIQDSLELILPYNEQEAAEIRVLRVYFNSWSKGRQWLTEAEMDSLTPIALSDETYFGDAAISARVLTGLEPSTSTNKLEDDEQISKSKPTLSNPFILYPNPNNGSLTLGFKLLEKGEATLQVTDLVGKTVKKFRLDETSSSTNINLENCPNGIYLIGVFQNGHKVFSSKFVLQK